MSTIKVNNVIPPNAGEGVTIDGLQMPTAGPLSNRSLIINGAMQVAQRATSVSGNTGNGYTTVDRMGLFQNLGGLNISQTTEAPSGFHNSIKYEVSSTGTASASTIVTPHQIVEGYSIAHLNWGSADAQNVTFSFWVRSSITGTYGAWIRNAAEDRYQPKEFTVSSANTWEKKTLTFTGETSGTWDAANGRGIAIGICLDAGSSRQGTADTWNTSDAFTTSNQTNFMANSGATFYLTGLQLEVGSKSTPFEHRSYDDELQRCQRYFEIFGGAKYEPIGVGKQRTTSQSYFNVVFRVEKRGAPTVTFTTGVITTDRYQYDQAISALGDVFTSTKGFHGRADHTAVGAEHRPIFILSGPSAPFGTMSFNSEL